MQGILRILDDHHTAAPMHGSGTRRAIIERPGEDDRHGVAAMPSSPGPEQRVYRGPMTVLVRATTQVHPAIADDQVMVRDADDDLTCQERHAVRG